MINPKVSIIIPAYNSAKTIVETISSVVNQSFSNWECIVVDDGSFDSTLQKVQLLTELHQNIHFIERDRGPKGVSTSRNIGLELAKGNYIVFLDADDILGRTCLEDRLRYAEEFPRFDFWVFKMQEFVGTIEDANQIHNKYPSNPSAEAYLCGFLKGRPPFSVTAPLWKRESIKKIKGFNEKLQLWEDPELHIRALARGLEFKVHIEAKADCFYRNDRLKKEKNKKNKSYIERVRKNTFLYHKCVLREVVIKYGKTSDLNKCLLDHIIRTIDWTIVDTKNIKWFLKYFSFVLGTSLTTTRHTKMLFAWFLFRLFNIAKIGRWHIEGFRKYSYSLIDK